MKPEISGTTGLLGVIGNPIVHSLSPAMYNYCFKYYGLDYVYLAFECDVRGVRDTLAAARQLGIKGLNVTMPCKQVAATQVDRLSEAAGFAKAVNTIVNENGILTGHITDGHGVVGDLRAHGKDVAKKDIVLLGAGGAASAIMIQLALDGADSITVFNRGEQGLKKMESIEHDMREKGVPCKLAFESLSDKELLHDMIRKCHILINATPVGMSPDSVGESVVSDMSVFRKDLVVYECVYNPAVTKLMSDAKAQGVPDENIIGGQGMLIWQGAAAFKLFTGLDMPVKELMVYLDERKTKPV